MRFVALFLSLVSLSIPISSLPTSQHDQSSNKVGRQQAYPDGNFIVVNNGLGQARGVPVNGGVVRFVAKYATASRWGQPVKSSQWLMVGSNPATLPPACPQPGLDPSQYSEDCLYMIAYVPTKVLNTASTAPVYVWYHGGSFEVGSATDPGLDGTKLANQIGGIVIFVQYRLGVLGFLPPASAGSSAVNLGVKDAIVALDFINTVMHYFGSNGQVTIGGQSSGAHMVRALIASPSASGFFRAATLHGDVTNYGFIKPNVKTILTNAFWANICNGGSLACTKTTSLSGLMDAQNTFTNPLTVTQYDPSVGTGEPLRPIVDGTTIQYSLTTNYPPQKKPLFITNNKNEAGEAIGGGYPTGIPVEAYPSIVNASLGPDRTATLLASPYYNPDPSFSSHLAVPYVSDTDVVLQALERLGTDQMWRCANWDFARRWTGAGGSAYVAMFELGATYPTNAYNNYCKTDGRVCHEDEKYILFGTTPSPTAAQTALTAEVQARLSKFINSPTTVPNSAPYLGWSAATTSDVKAIQFGGADSQPAPVLACDPSFWGAAVKFDWQQFGE